MARPGRSERNRTARSFSQLRRFHHVIKSDKVFGSHTAEAALEQAEAQYRARVITAFQNVADALRALQADARAIKAAVHAEDTSKASIEIVQKQLNAGQVNQLAVLNAQQTYLTAAIIRVQTEANRLSDTAALCIALGGGWPVGCTTPVWRECAMGDAPVPIATSKTQ
jgi:hypothetical protein